MREDESKILIIKMDILPQEMRIKELMNEEYNEFEHYLIIDSEDRESRYDYTNPSDYTIILGVEIYHQMKKVI